MVYTTPHQRKCSHDSIAAGIGVRARRFQSYTASDGGGREIRAKDWCRIGLFSSRPVTYTLSEMPPAASGTSPPIEKPIRALALEHNASTAERRSACTRLQVFAARVAKVVLERGGPIIFS